MTLTILGIGSFYVSDEKIEIRAAANDCVLINFGASNVDFAYLKEKCKDDGKVVVRPDNDLK